MINKTTFGLFIRQKRTEKGLTQKELAQLLFLSESAVSKWEMGKSYPDITLIPDICKVLDVSEKELISGAVDTEYRKIKNEARLYRKLSETFFWGFMLSYIFAFVITLVCDLCINRKLTFSPEVFAGLLTASSFIPTYTRFTQKHKLLVFAASTYMSIAFLFAVECIKTDSDWFFIAAAGTLLGYFIVFGRLLLKKYLPEKGLKFIPAIYFASVFFVIMLLILSVRLTVEFNISDAIKILIYSYIPFAFISVMHLINCDKRIKASADIFIFTLFLYFTQKFVSSVLKANASGDYTVNFADWENSINGNIYFILLCAGVLISLILLIFGLKKKNIR